MSSYVVTGAARGIGFEFINQISADPKNTAIAIVRKKATAQKLEALGRPNVHIIEADIQDSAALKAAAEETSKITGGKLDVLINNAAIVDIENSPLTLTEFTTEDRLKGLGKSFDTNVVGVIQATNSFLPLLEAGTHKKAVLLTTGLAEQAFNEFTENPVHIPYIISKVAANAIWWKYAIQYKSQGFTFLAISPGYVNTSVIPLTEEQKESLVPMEDGFRRYNPDFAGMITPEESVRHQLDTIAKVGPKDSGAFLSHFGNKQWL